MIIRECPKCGLYSLKKNGTRNGKQRLRCGKCRYVFEIKKGRGKAKVNRDMMAVDYMLYNETYEVLAYRYGMNKKKIQQELDNVSVKKKSLVLMKQYG